MSTALRDIFELPGTSASRRRRWRNRIVLGLVGVLLGTTAGFGVHILLTSCGGPGSGVRVIGDQCIGVTDGSYVFHEDYRTIEEKIKAENDRVNGIVNAPGQLSGRAVTIALLNPMTVDENSAFEVIEVRNLLEGAYTAQYRVNHSAAAGDPNPLIRLVLANEGSRQEHWEPVLDQLLDLKDADAPLNAVVGLGVSIDLTEQAAKRLAAADIPTVGAITTARQLNYQNIEGFVRVAPSDRDYVAGLRAYLAERPGLDSAILVYDRNSESRGDIFIDSLRSELTAQMGGLIKFPALSFVGRSQASDADPTLFANIINSICAVAPKVVFFAGRKTDLRGFLDSLGSRTCPELPMTVITVDADLNVFGEETSQDKKITLVYADATDPNGWVSGVVPPPDGIADTTDPSGWVSGVARPPDGFLEFKTSFENLGFLVGHLDDGMAISYHDAVLTAVRAIRLADVSIEGPDVPQATDVLNQMLNLNGQFQVLGASGTLNYSYRGTDGKESGDPVGKPIPVVELHSSGTLPVTKGAYYVMPE